MSLHKQIRNQLLTNLSAQANNGIEQLNNALRLCAKWRSVLIQNTVIKHQGTIIHQGPFAGLNFLDQSAEGCHIAKLLGCYEQPLQPFIYEAIKRNYHTLLNIGCAEGFYAVGMARNMPDTRIMAYDINPKAQETCKLLAKKNSVDHLVSVNALFEPKDFEQYGQNKTLILCDIEGNEAELLDPEIAPALKTMDLIVESHEVLIPGITKRLIQRFQQSHQITLVQDNGQRQLDPIPEWFYQLNHLDQLLAVWEWRTGPTPWLIMTAK
jgi:hypothetical protein